MVDTNGAEGRNLGAKLRQRCYSRVSGSAESHGKVQHLCVYGRLEMRMSSPLVQGEQQLY